MGLFARRDRIFGLAFGVLCVLFVTINFMDWTVDINLLKLDDETVAKGAEDIRLNREKTSMRTTLSPSATAGRHSNLTRTSGGERKLSQKNVRKEGIRSDGAKDNETRKANYSKNGTSNSGAIPVQLHMTNLSFDQKHEVNLTKNTTKDNEQRAKLQRLQRENPMFSDRVINPHPFHFINKSGDCSQHAPHGKVFLLILVACRPEEVRDRRWIRDTWGSVKAYRDKVLTTRFLVGRAPRKIYTRKIISEESAVYGDIVQENFDDTYQNMTHKVLMGLKWAGQMCPRATYVMNLDSDMFVNVFRLVNLLEKMPRTNFAIGHLKGPTLPQRTQGKKIHSKWYTPFEMYPESTFPPYLNGPAYVMSGDLPGRIFNESLHVRYLPWDDVYIGMVMKKLRVQMTYGDRFEEYPVRWNGVAVLNSILNGIASYVGHQRAYNFVLRDIWGQVLEQFDNYVFSPPPDSLLRLNDSHLRHW